MSVLAASAVAVVWLTIGLVTAVALIAMLIALVRHAMLIGRAASRFQEEVAPIAGEIGARSAAASRGAAGLQRGTGRARR
jgi:hypothetical protein